MKRLIVVAFACVISGSSFAQKVNDLPVPGQSGSLERWMISNKVDDLTVAALRICEANVVRPIAPPIGINALPFNAEFTTPCTALRKKVYDAAISAANVQKTSDKSLVESAVAR